MHRVVVEDNKGALVDFLCDLCHEWPFDVSALTLLTDPEGTFPDRAPADRARGVRMSWEQLCGDFKRALPYSQSVPNLLPEVLPVRPRTLWLRRLKAGESLTQAVRRVVSRCIARYNLWEGAKPVTWRQTAMAARPLDVLLCRARTAASVGDAALLRLLAARALVRYSEKKRNEAWQRAANRQAAASTKADQKRPDR